MHKALKIKWIRICLLLLILVSCNKEIKNDESLDQTLPNFDKQQIVMNYYNFDKSLLTSYKISEGATRTIIDYEGTNSSSFDFWVDQNEMKYYPKNRLKFEKDINLYPRFSNNITTKILNVSKAKDYKKLYLEGEIHSYIRTNLNNDKKEDYIITFKHSEYIIKIYFMISNDSDYVIQELTTEEEFGIYTKFSNEINKNSLSNIKNYDFENIYILDLDNNGFNEIYISLIGELIPRKLLVYEFNNNKMMNILDASSNILYLDNYRVDLNNKTIKVLEYKRSLQYDEYNSLSEADKKEYSDNLYIENLITYKKEENSFTRTTSIKIQTKREDYY